MPYPVEFVFDVPAQTLAEARAITLTQSFKPGIVDYEVEPSRGTITLVLRRVEVATAAARPAAANPTGAASAAANPCPPVALTASSSDEQRTGSQVGADVGGAVLGGGSGRNVGSAVGGVLGALGVPPGRRNRSRLLQPIACAESRATQGAEGPRRGGEWPAPLASRGARVPLAVRFRIQCIAPGGTRPGLVSRRSVLRPDCASVRTPGPCRISRRARPGSRASQGSRRSRPPQRNLAACPAPASLPRHDRTHAQRTSNISDAPKSNRLRGSAECTFDTGHSPME